VFFTYLVLKINLLTLSLLVHPSFKMKFYLHDFSPLLEVTEIFLNLENFHVLY
jgi:hypothetical protein